MAEVQNVTYSKPKIEGAVSTAPVGTALPADATTKLDAAFKNLGYISADGLSNENSPESDAIKAWGGDTVLVVQKDKADTFSYKLIEVTNVDVLKEVYGDNNVTGDLTAGIAIKANTMPLVDKAIVIDMVLKGGALKRIVIPRASIIELGEIHYGDEDAVGYELKVQAIPDNGGNTHYEYIVKGQV